VLHMPMLIHHASHLGACLASSQTPFEPGVKCHALLKRLRSHTRIRHHPQAVPSCSAGGRPPPGRSRIAPRRPIAHAAHASMKTFFLFSVEQVYFQAEANLLAMAQAHCLGEAPAPNAEEVV